MRVVPHFFFLLKDVGFEEVGREEEREEGGRECGLEADVELLIQQDG